MIFDEFITLNSVVGVGTTQEMDHNCSAVTHLACVLQSNTQYYLGGDHTSVIFGENNCLVSDKVDLNDIYYKPDTSPVRVRPLFTHIFTLQCSHNVQYYFGITSQIPESNTRLEHVHTSTARYTARSCTCPRRTWHPSTAIPVREPPGSRFMRP